MKSSLLVNKLVVFILCYWSRLPGTLCLRNVILTMPDAVERGEKVRFVCRYNLEGETLYTLKWYRGEQEFYRFTPKESPPIKMFPVAGYPELEVVKEESNGEQVTIRKALPSIAGRYSCEVTTDAPSFHAQSGQGELRVVVLPKQFPIINGNKPKIKAGEWANVTCISSGSIPAANLTWSINNRPVVGKHTITNSQRVLNAVDQEESVSNLFFQTEESHFRENNSLKVRCTASIYSIYQQTTEISILPDRPNKWLHMPQTQRNPTPYTELTSVKLSRSNVHIDKEFSENNINVIEAKNLERNRNTNNSNNVSTSLRVIATTVMTRLLFGKCFL